MLDHGHADVAPLSGHDVEASGRKARFVKQAGQHERRQRRVLGRLGDNRAAGDERGAELEGQQGHRIVERRNRNHDADRFARHDHLFAGRPGERHLRMDAKTFLRVDIHEIGGSFDFGDCRGERADEFGCERAAQLGRALTHQVCGPFLQARTCRDRRSAPRLESALGGHDRNVRISFAAGGYGVDNGAGCGIDDIVAGARCSLSPAAVDEHVHARSLIKSGAASARRGCGRARARPSPVQPRFPRWPPAFPVGRHRHAASS